MKKLPFGFARPEHAPGFLLWQTTMLWQRQIKKVLDEHELSHGQFVILATLLWFSSHGYETTQVNIANWSKLDKMTVSKSLKKLAEMECIERQEHTTDTRAKNVQLTKKGRALVKRVVPLVEAVDKEFFGKVGSQQHPGMLKILSTLSAE